GLPDLAEHFAAHALFARLAAGHHALGRGEDVDAEASQHTWDLVAPDVDAATGSRDALQVRDGGFVVAAVLQIDAQHLAAFLFSGLEIGDVALFLEDAGDLQLQLGRRSIDLGMPRAHRVADAGQEISYWIGKAHVILLYCPFAPASRGTCGSGVTKIV